jgi:hypothetical protein
MKLLHNLKRWIFRHIDAEWLVDLLSYLKNRNRDVIRRFPPWRIIEIDYKKTVNLVFFCGIGDAIYGLPVFAQIRRRCDEHQVRLVAWCARTTGASSNTAVAALLSDSKLFHEVNIFTGVETDYWKSFFWDFLGAKVGIGVNDANFYPFIYSTNRKFRRRLDAIRWQFDLQQTPSLAQWGDTFLPQINYSDAALRLKRKIEIQGGNQRVVFIHLDSRSGNYQYPHVDWLIGQLLSKDFLVLTSTPVFEWHVSKHDRFVAIDPKDLSVFELGKILKQFAARIIAINSIMWPISEFAELDTLGLHYLNSPDGHQFSHEKMFFVSSRRDCVAKVASGLHVGESNFTGDVTITFDHKWLLAISLSFLEAHQ